jgi:hypothetical protein
LVKIALLHESRQKIYIEYISLGMTKVFVTFPMLPKTGWAEPTRQKNPGAASTSSVLFYPNNNVFYNTM